MNSKKSELQTIFCQDISNEGDEKTEKAKNGNVFLSYFLPFLCTIVYFFIHVSLLQ
jgi:hypothetical protein